MPIPSLIKASTALTRSAQYAGALAPDRLERLGAELAQPGSHLDARLELAREDRKDWLRGRVEGALWLQCRRCLQAFEWTLDLGIELRLVYSDADEARVLEQADPYRVEDDQLPLAEIVEDEVLLALPMMPRCSSCEAAGAAADSAVEEPVAETRKPNPFAQLLKK